ncbi:MAG: cytochrome c3 family protein [Deltaproteobacteria bacterium]|nr:cytochrome c3 family protein [Deltaproteobacteria bacterium]
MMGKKLDFYVLKIGGIVALTILIAIGTGLYLYLYPKEFIEVGYAPQQPIAYSHKLHAGDLQISCFYCHGNAEKLPSATIPPTQVCMNCHSIVKRGSPEVQKIVESYEKNKPIKWVRVHKLPDFVHFKHNVHVKAGISCFDCHGKIYEMEVVRQEKPLSMGWCLDCHRKETPLTQSPRVEDFFEKATKDELFYQKFKDNTKKYKGIHWVEEQERIGCSLNCSACHY